MTVDFIIGSFQRRLSVYQITLAYIGLIVYWRIQEIQQNLGLEFRNIVSSRENYWIFQHSLRFELVEKTGTKQGFRDAKKCVMGMFRYQHWGVVAPRDPHNRNHPETVIRGQPIDLEKHIQSSRNKDLTLPRVCDIG